MEAIIAQILGLITGSMSIISICMSKRKSFLYSRCVKGTLNCIQNYFLKEPKAIPLVITEVVQSYVYAKVKKKWIAVPFICLIYGLCLWLYRDLKLVLLLVGYTFSSIAFLNEDIKKIKIYQGLIYIMWMPWDVTIGNYAKVLCHLIACIIIVYQILSSKRKLSEESQSD